MRTCLLDQVRPVTSMSSNNSSNNNQLPPNKATTTFSLPIPLLNTQPRIKLHNTLILPPPLPNPLKIPTSV